MLEWTKKPVFFERNRVFRVYKGGMLFHNFIGDKKEDNNYPEEWVASAVKAMNRDSSNPLEGLSILEGTKTTFKELLEAYPKEMIGEKKCFDVLVKYLDSAIRLPLQAHPDRTFSEKYFKSTYGKTEMWLILATRENASICFGFKEKMTEEQFSDVVEESKTNKQVMDQYLNKVQVKTGDVFLIPAKAVHAIGYGCLILEVQEPTDFTIQPEYWCGDYMLDEYEMYLGLPKAVGLKCFDYSICGEESIRLAKKTPIMVEKNENYTKEIVISYEDTPCFAVIRYFIAKKMELLESPAIYVVAEGSGFLKRAKNYERKIKMGDYFFLPVSASHYSIETETGIQVVACLPSA